MTKKLDDAIAATLAASQPAGCWAIRLDGEAAAYVTAMREAEISGRYGRISRVTMQTELADRWGIRIGDDVLRRHMRGVCSCGVSS